MALFGLYRHHILFLGLTYFFFLDERDFYIWLREVTDEVTN
jgi:hypothetical protein